MMGVFDIILFGHNQHNPYITAGNMIYPPPICKPKTTVNQEPNFSFKWHLRVAFFYNSEVSCSLKKNTPKKNANPT